MLPPCAGAMALDFEASGRLVYAADFVPRMCQITFDGCLAYLIPADDKRLIRHVVGCAETLIVHNGSYDLAVLDRCYGVPLEATWPKAVDTQEMARILYPTASEALKDLMREHLGLEITDSDKALRAEFARLKLRPIETGYARIPLDNEIFQMYAGLDPIGTFRLWQVWRDRVDAGLLRAEHALQYQTAAITRRGLRLDVAETQRQIDTLAAAVGAAEARLALAGVAANPAKDEARTALQGFLERHGATTSLTPKSRKLKIGAEDLALATMEATDEARAVVADIVLIRQCGKTKASYLDAFLASAEADGRLHPTIRTMAARTHRMSISTPPLQQIPAHPLLTTDTRGCLIADPGMTLISADYAQIEQRVMATLARQENMLQAIRDGLDFHRATARDMYQVALDDVSDQQRDYAKRAGFLMIYGGGPRRLAITAKIPVRQAADIIRLFKKTYPAVVDYSDYLQHCPEIVTPFGRHLPIDASRRYAATNYMVQSTARDLFVMGGVSIIKAGYSDYLWLPIHDEWILAVPIDEAEAIAEELAGIMYTDFYGTPIAAQGVVIGERWRKA
jgi:DNA polymerase-1